MEPIEIRIRMLIDGVNSAINVPMVPFIYSMSVICMITRRKTLMNRVVTPLVDIHERARSYVLGGHKAIGSQ
jgi:hypothetical protein